MAASKGQNSSKTSDSITFYDDAQHDYRDFWSGRDYENESETIALNKLLSNQHFSLTMDYGGGYGRSVPELLKFSDRLILAEPSTKQLDIAKEYLKAYSNVELDKVTKKDTVPTTDGSLDLLVMIRVSHHLPDIEPTIKAIARALKPGGKAIIEVANEAHFLNRLRYLAKGKSIPKQPVPVGVRSNGIEDQTPFVNHNPNTIQALLEKQNLRVKAKLSVSNLRNQSLKRFISMKTMLIMEKFLQTKLAFLNFGPSIFFLVEKQPMSNNKQP